MDFHHRYVLTNDLHQLTLDIWSTDLFTFWTGNVSTGHLWYSQCYQTFNHWTWNPVSTSTVSKQNSLKVLTMRTLLCGHSLYAPSTHAWQLNLNVPYNRFDFFSQNCAFFLSKNSLIIKTVFMFTKIQLLHLLCLTNLYNLFDKSPVFYESTKFYESSKCYDMICEN